MLADDDNDDYDDDNDAEMSVVILRIYGNVTLVINAPTILLIT
jgi:hypothetical protein